MKNTLKLAGLLVIAITVITCTPKQSGTATQKQSISEVTVTEETKTGDDFSFGIETGNGPEYPQFVVDSGGNSFTFHRNKPLKDIRLISIGITEEGKLYEDNVYAYALEETGFYDNIGFYEEGKRYEGNVFTSVPNEIGSFFLMVSVSEGIPTRGIAFTDENGKRKYFYISMSGMDGSPLLNEFQNTAKPQTSSSDFQMDGTTLVQYNGNDGSVVIPSSVTVIGERAFRGSGLTSITIPSSVITIGDYAFAYSKSLVSVTIPSSVTTIGEGAFCYCESLTSIDIPSSVTSIGAEAFFESVLEIVTLSRITDFVKEGDTASFPSYVQFNYRD